MNKLAIAVFTIAVVWGRLLYPESMRTTMKTMNAMMGKGGMMADSCMMMNMGKMMMGREE